MTTFVIVERRIDVVDYIYEVQEVQNEREAEEVFRSGKRKFIERILFAATPEMTGIVSVKRMK